MSTETIVSEATTAAAKAEADLKELQSYITERKAIAKDAAANLKAVEASVKAYAPRVVNGVKWLNKNARGWTAGLLQTNDSGFTILPTPEPKQWASLGLNPDPKVDKRTSVEGDAVLGLLWQTAVEIQKSKKSVTVPLLLKRVGLS